jgi:hypothetical protein
MRHIWVIESKRKETEAPWKIYRNVFPFTNKNDATRCWGRLTAAFKRQLFRLVKYVPEGE